MRKKQRDTIPFLDTLIQRRDDGTVKVKVYRKKTHTNQYLAFNSHRPLLQKRAVVRTLLDRCEDIITEEEDRKEWKDSIRDALKVCGYPGWTKSGSGDESKGREEEVQEGE